MVNILENKTFADVSWIHAPLSGITSAFGSRETEKQILNAEAQNIGKGNKPMVGPRGGYLSRSGTFPQLMCGFIGQISFSNKIDQTYIFRLTNDSGHLNYILGQG